MVHNSTVGRRETRPGLELPRRDSAEAKIMIYIIRRPAWRVECARRAKCIRSHTVLDVPSRGGMELRRVRCLRIPAQNTCGGVPVNTQTDRQLALLKFSIEAGILLCGNGVSRHVGCTHARTHARLQSPK